MIPIQLSLKGVYSYQERQIIDFQSLTSAGLFGIFGKVGSGKSSIVEAITYVLYGETKRLDRSGMSYNLTNLSSDKIEIDYIFSVSKKSFRFQALGSRNSKHYEKVEIKRFAYQWNETITDWEPIEPLGEKIIGLGYDDFRRAVIIPQGNFQEFLELSQKERNQMMQTLFGLERFDLANNTKLLKDANELNIKEFESRLSELGNLTADYIAEFEQKQKNKENERIEWEKNREQAQDELTILENLKLDIEAANLKKNKLESLENQVFNFENRRRSLKEFRDISTFVKPALDTWNEALKEVNEISGNLEKINLRNKALLQELDKANEQEKQLKTAFEQRDSLKNQAKELEDLAEIGVLSSNVKEQIQLQNVEKSNFLNQQQAIENVKKQQEIVLSNIEKIKSQKIDIQQITSILYWFQTKETLEKERENIKNEGKKVHEAELELQASKSKFLNANLPNINAESSFTDIEKQISQNLLENEAKTEAMEQERAVLVQKVALLQHAHTLTDGEPCPLCGAVHHPQPLVQSDDDATKEMAIIDAKKATLKQQKNELILLEKELNQVVAKLQIIDNQKDTIRKSYDAKKIAIEEHEAKYVTFDTKFTEKTQIQAAQKEYEIQQKTLADLENAFNQNLKLKDSLEAKLKDIEQNLRNIESKISTNSVQIAFIEKNIKTLQIADYQNFSASDLKLKATQLLMQFEQIAKEYELAQNEKQRVQNEQLQAQTQAQQFEQFLAKAQQKATENEAKLNAVLSENDVPNLQTVLDVLKQSLDIKQEETAIEAFFQTLNIAKHEAASAVEKIKDLFFDIEVYENKKLIINELKERIDKNIEEIGGLKKQIEQAKINFERQKEFQSSLQKAKLRQENIAVLESLFRAQGFVNFASRVYLQNLVSIANDRFVRMTQRQLKLQLTENNDFEVLDLLNGGRNRSVRTLSGGQKFQASLCLALALTDSISGAHRENFFFLDEGFGSLDKASLQIVFETLQSLRKENRVVGIISHVEDMQLEIEHYIQVELDERRGSLVEVR